MNPLLLMGRKRLVPGATAVYLFDEGAGTVLRDSSGNGNNGTLGTTTTAPTWTTAGLSFDGEDLVTLPALTFTGAFTLSWVGNHTESGTYDCVLGNSSTTDHKLIFADTNAKLIVKLAGTSLTQVTVPTGSAVMITVIRNAANAVTVTLGTGTPTPVGTASGSVTFNALGRDQGVSGYYDGSLSTFSAHPFAFTTAQTAQQYAVCRRICASRGVTLA